MVGFFIDYFKEKIEIHGKLKGKYNQSRIKKLISRNTYLYAHLWSEKMIKTQLMNVLEKALDGSSQRHVAITNNIANANTPGYKRVEVSFQEALQEALEPQAKLKRTKEKHLPLPVSLEDPGIIQMRKNSITTMRNDGSNVDIDMEEAALAANTLYFNSMAQMLSEQLSLLRASITEGKR